MTEELTMFLAVALGTGAWALAIFNADAIASLAPGWVLRLAFLIGLPLVVFLSIFIHPMAPILIGLGFAGGFVCFVVLILLGMAIFD